MRSVDIVVPIVDPDEKDLQRLSFWGEQEFLCDIEWNFILVVDGKSEQDFSSLYQLMGDRLNVVIKYERQGRASARNSGLKSGTGDYVAFFDADCLPANKYVIHSFLKSMKNGYDYVFAKIRSRNQGFWACYFNQVCAEREKRFIGGDNTSMTAAGFMISRNFIEKVSGFDEQYMYYGFEDRDLYARLFKEGGRAGFCSEAIVYHDDSLNLKSVCSKMQEAGKYTASIFSKRHPDIYENMKYDLIDIRNKNIIYRNLLRLFSTLYPFVFSVSTYVVDSSYFSYKCKSFFVRLATASAFMRGALESKIYK